MSAKNLVRNRENAPVGRFEIGDFIKLPATTEGKDKPLFQDSIDALDLDKGEAYGIVVARGRAVFVAKRRWGRGWRKYNRRRKWYYPLTTPELIPSSAILIPEEEEGGIPEPIGLALGVARFSIPYPG